MQIKLEFSCCLTVSTHTLFYNSDYFSNEQFDSDELIIYKFVVPCAMCNQMHFQITTANYNSHYVESGWVQAEVCWL